MEESKTREIHSKIAKHETQLRLSSEYELQNAKVCPSAFLSALFSLTLSRIIL